MRWLFALFISLMVSDLIGSDSSEIEERKLIGGRYVFMQSGFPVEKKTLQYQNLNGVLNDIQYGITDDISMATGVVLPFYIYLAPQYSVEVADKQRLILGDIAASSMFLEDEDALNVNLLYAGYTYGDLNNHATVAMGYMATNLLPNSSLWLQLGGTKRLAKGIYLMGEFWYSNGYQEVKGVSRWKLDAAGNKILVDPSDPLRSPYQLKKEDLLLNRHTLYANLQFRMISTRNSSRSWSFGLMYFANWGGEYQDHGPYGESRDLSNLFVLPLPSISFIQRIGDFRPQDIPIRRIGTPSF